MKESVKVLLTEEEVDRKIDELGKQITRDYEGKRPHLICVLKGGAPFMCELAKRIELPLTMDFMSVESYEGSASTGHITLKKDLDNPVLGLDVLIVEDIIDSGRTLSHLVKLLGDRGAASIRLCTLLDKPMKRVVDDIKVDYCGFNIPDAFVVGYGLDYNQKYRNLPYIGVVEFEEEDS